MLGALFLQNAIYVCEHIATRHSVDAAWRIMKAVRPHSVSAHCRFYLRPRDMLPRNISIALVRKHSVSAPRFGLKRQLLTP